MAFPSSMMAFACVASMLVSASAVAAPSPTIVEYAIPTPASGAASIARGPDGDLWFTENTAGKIGRITPTGAVTEFSLPAGAKPQSITAGPDRNLWFTDKGTNAIGRITTAGSVLEFALPAAGSYPYGITQGPDGNLWFTEWRCGGCDPRAPGNGGTIGRITPAGAIAEFTLPTYFSLPETITPGPDGNLWFVETAANQFGRITPTGAVTEFAHVDGDYSALSGITPGPDGNLWFTKIFSCYGLCTAPTNPIGKLTPSAVVVTEFAQPAFDSFAAVTSGPDGNLWFTDSSGYVETGANKVAKIVIVPAGGVAVAALPAASDYALVCLAVLLAFVAILAERSRGL